jgi:hypothetical protein
MEIGNHNPPRRGIPASQITGSAVSVVKVGCKANSPFRSAADAVNGRFPNTEAVNIK